MQDIRLEEKMRNLAASYIYQDAVSSLLLLLVSVTEDMEKGEQALPFPIHEDILTLKKEVLDMLITLEDKLGTEEEERSALLEKCVAMKEKLFSIYETVCSYTSQCNLLMTVAGDEICLRKYKEEKISGDGVDWSLFYADCRAFLESSESIWEKQNRMGMLLGCLPMRVAREKYYGKIQDSLRMAFAGQSKEFIEKSLRSFLYFSAPTDNTLYGKYFPEIAEWLQKKTQILPYKLENEELKELYDELTGLAESLGEIQDYFDCLFHDIQSLILLLYLTFNFAELTEGDSAHADLYYTICEFIKGEADETEREAYLEVLNERLERALVPVLDKANDIYGEAQKLLQKAENTEAFSEDTQKMLFSMEFIRECFYIELEEALFDVRFVEELPPASEEEKERLFAEFIQKTRAYLETLPPTVRKAAMRNLSGALPSSDSVEDMMAHLINIVDETISPEEKAVIVNKIGTVFEENGYEPIVSEAETEEGHDSCGCGHDHHHGDSCGCGHNHHHGDSCGCGHDHHHGDNCGCGHDHHHE